MAIKFTTTRVSPEALELIRLLAVVTKEKQFQLLERLLKNEAGRVGLKYDKQQQEARAPGQP